MFRWQIIVVCVIAALVFNWPRQNVECVTDTVSAFQSSRAQSKTTDPINFANTSTASALRLAGWPCVFYQCTQWQDDMQTSTFSWSALLTNIICWIAAGLLFNLYLVFSRRKRMKVAEESVEENTSTSPTDQASVSISKKSKRTQHLQLSDMMVATAIAALVLGNWQICRVRADRDRKLAEEIAASGGEAKLVGYLPTLLENYPSLHAAHTRICEVRLNNPSDELVERVASLPYLMALKISGGSYDTQRLKPLIGNPFLVSLSIVGRQLDTSAIEIISQLKTLTSLNLMRTNITANGLMALDLSGLQKLNIVHTDVKLAELGKPPFADSLKILCLPHPPKGQEDSVAIDGWQNLEEISCYEHDEFLNSEPVRMRLKNLPNLNSLKLDLLQLFDLEFEQLPRLAKIEGVALQWQQRASTKQIIPAYPWVRNLKLRDTPQLRSLSLCAVQAETIDVSHQSGIDLRLSVYDRNAEREGSSYNVVLQPGRLGKSRSLPPGYLDSSKISKSTRQKWIDDLGSCDGLSTLNLSYLPLDGIDLTPIARNNSVKKLFLGNSNLNIAQLKSLSGMKNLEELFLENLAIDGRVVEWLAISFPNLRRIVCDRRAVTRLRLEHVQNLESVFERPKTDEKSTRVYDDIAINIDALKLVDVPKLRDQIYLREPVVLLHIESAPSLRGLSIEARLPAKTVIKGIRDLQFFAAGGTACDDTLVNEVLNCKGLTRLTLAYSSATSETLAKVGELTELEYLVLTGSNVNDEVASQFSKLIKLKTLRLDNTQITEATARLATNFKNLQHLDLGSLPLQASTVSDLVKLRSLQILSLAGSEITAEHLDAISNLENLTTLDLSRTNLSNELLAQWSQKLPSKLVELKLNQAKLGMTGFAKLVRAMPPNVRFCLRDTAVDSNLMDWLVGQDRVLEFDEESTRIITRNLIGGAIQRSTIASGNPSETELADGLGMWHESNINPELFAPATKPKKRKETMIPFVPDDNR